MNTAFLDRGLRRVANALTFRSREISLRRYLFAQVYGQLCGQAYFKYLHPENATAEVDGHEVAELASQLVSDALHEIDRWNEGENL